MKKCYLFLLLINVFLFNCGNNKSKLKTEDDYDHHQFFKDLAHTELSDLELIIKQSDKIVAYDWNGNNGNPASMAHDYIVDAYGQFDKTVGKSFELSKTQIQELKAILTNKTSYNEPVAMCFLPHIAFVYYRDNKITGQSNVCFLCEGVKNIPKFNGSLSKKGTEKLKNFCKTIGIKIIDDESQTKG
jgi:hypothetical protein